MHLPGQLAALVSLYDEYDHGKYFQCVRLLFPNLFLAVPPFPIYNESNPSR